MGSLRVGERLQLADGEVGVVTSLDREDAPEGETFTTYNFEVEDYHTYFVLPQGSALSHQDAVWVHNACATNAKADGDVDLSDGGAYGRFENIKQNGKNITEKNHIPSTNSYELAGFSVSRYLGSAHIMLKPHHRDFISTGSNRMSKRFRHWEAYFLKKGAFMQAFDLNVRKLRKSYGSQYNTAIEKAREHFLDEVIPILKEQI